MKIKDFLTWLNITNFTRDINKIQIHHCYIPSIEDFKKNPNPEKIQSGMKKFHMEERGFSDIAQNITIFPNGEILIGRPFDVIPAGIKNANTGALCIEVVGNFDKEEMTPEIELTIIETLKGLIKKFNIKIDTDHIIYHAWYNLNTGKQIEQPKDGELIKATESNKTCPGLKFQGGNTKYFCKKNLLPKLAT